jgi:hypothetical protein
MMEQYADYLDTAASSKVVTGPFGRAAEPR